MANGQSQGLQVALIIFVVLTLALGVTTFVFYKQYSEAEQQRIDAASEAQKQRALVNVAQDEVNLLKRLIGHDYQEVGKENNPAPNTVVGKYKEDMEAYSGDIPNKTYHDVVEYMDNQLANLRTENARLLSDNERLEELHVNRESVKETEIQAQLAAYREAKTDLMNRTEEFDDTVRRKDAEISTVVDKANQVTAELQQSQLDAEYTQNRLGNTINEQKQIMERLTERIEEMEEPDYEVRDAKVIDVDQKNRVAYINVGYADGLPKHETFGIYGTSKLNLAKREKKGELEVTDIHGPHLAEGRISGDEISDPILPNDDLYTPLWSPGRKERFALMGFMDLDEDGKSDRETVRNIIISRGGVIDAEVADDGIRTGNISIDTKYVVRGEEPPLDDPHGSRVRTEMTSMFEEAHQLGVKVIGINRLLDLAAYRPKRRLHIPGTERFSLSPRGGRDSSEESASDSGGL